MSRVAVIDNFLKGLQDSNTTMSLMVDRMDLEVLSSINNYSETISKIKGNTTLSDKDIISCAMILGYLLKGHIDRYDLEKCIPEG
jgi:hypothetical protein